MKEKQTENWMKLNFFTSQLNMSIVHPKSFEFRSEVKSMEEIQKMQEKNGEKIIFEIEKLKSEYFVDSDKISFCEIFFYEKIGDWKITDEDGNTSFDKLSKKSEKILQNYLNSGWEEIKLSEVDCKYFFLFFVFIFKYFFIYFLFKNFFFF